MGTNLISISPTVDKLRDKAIDFAFQNGPKILVAILILIIGFIVANWVNRAVTRSLARKNLEPPIRMLISRVVKLTVIVLALIIALENAGMDLAPVIAGIGVAGVGIGLAMQGVLGNLFAGLTIIFTKPFRVGEYVELGGVQGQVHQIELFTTVLIHADMSRVIVPNRKIVGEILHNYGNIRQLNLTVGISYATDITKVVAMVREILDQNPRVLKDPVAAIGVTTLGDFAITLAIKPWATVDNFGPAQAEILQEVLNRFRANKIEIPYPRREVRHLNVANTV